MTATSPLSRLDALPPLQAHRSLTDAVHDALREAITHGVIGPGTRLPEVTIARQLDVSPTPVREALRRLGEEGLVQTSPHRGAMVVLCTPADLANLYELHEVLEQHAVSRAAERVAADPGAYRAAIEQLHALLGALDQAVPDSDQTGFNRLDLRFHRTLNAIAGNALLTDEIEQVHRRIQSARMRFDVQLPDRPARSQAQHRALVEAVSAGDVARAQELAGEHVRAVRDLVISLLAEGTST